MTGNRHTRQAASSILALQNKPETRGIVTVMNTQLFTLLFLEASWF